MAISRDIGCIALAFGLAFGCENTQSATEHMDGGYCVDCQPDAAGSSQAKDVGTGDEDWPTFVCRNSGTVVPRSLFSESEFRLLERGAAEITRRSDLVEEGMISPDGSLSTTGTYLTAPPGMRGGRGALVSMFVESGEDVVLQGGWWTETPVAPSTRASVTLLVNFKPVVATYTFRGPENLETLAQIEDTGALFPMTGDFLNFEIVVDGAEFESPGIYDLALRAHVYDEDGRIASRDSRISLFAGGYAIPEHPCFEAAEYSAPTDLERDLYDVSLRGSGMVFPETLSERAALVDEDLDIIPRQRPSDGEEALSLYFRATLDEPQTMVWVPLLNGRPIAPASFVYLPAFRVLYGPAHRSQFDLSIPSGLRSYDFVVAQWFNPFQPNTSPTGEPILRPTPPLSGTNYLFYLE